LCHKRSSILLKVVSVLPHEAETIFFRKEESNSSETCHLFCLTRQNRQLRKNIFYLIMSSVWSKITNSGKITKELDNE